LKSELLKIVVAIDTSGSIDTKLLAIFFAHFQAIMESFKSYEIDLIECDAKIQEHHLFYPGDTIEYKDVGGGGTDFRPVFEYVDRHISDVQLLIYFTDGFGTFPEKEPMFDTLWVMPEKVCVPFGDILTIS
jgi:predicted metal-dependent peptidase